MKDIIRKILKGFGYEIRRSDPFPIASPNRPVGDMKKLLEDLKARGLDCKAILDVGAHMGFWSRMAKEVYPQARFCLIEPQIEMEVPIKAFCESANNSVYFIAGAGAKKDQKYLTKWDDPSGSSFLPREDDALKISGNQIKVDIITIDDIVNDQFPIPTLAKLDVQGYELEALKGAIKLFGTTEVFILEVSLFSFGNDIGMPVFSDVINFMLERDYVVYDFPGFSRRPYDGALAQCDICFVKKNSFLRSSNNWD